MNCSSCKVHMSVDDLPHSFKRLDFEASDAHFVKFCENAGKNTQEGSHLFAHLALSLRRNENTAVHQGKKCDIFPPFGVNSYLNILVPRSK